jgi:hypothetical protein
VCVCVCACVCAQVLRSNKDAELASMQARIEDLQAQHAVSGRLRATYLPIYPPTYLPT